MTQALSAALFVDYRPAIDPNYSASQIFTALDGAALEARVASLTGEATLFPSGDRRVWQLSADIRDIHQEVILALRSPNIVEYFCPQTEARQYLSELLAEPPSWPLAVDKTSLLVSLARRLRQYGARFTATGGQLRTPSVVKPASSVTATNTQGTTEPIPKTTAKDVRGAVASTVYLKLATNEVIAAEALVEPLGDPIAETCRQVTEYGQRGWALNFSNGHSQTSVSGAGLPANFMHSNTGLLRHARWLVVEAIGVGRDRGNEQAKVTAIAGLLVVGNWDDGQVTDRSNPVWSYRPTLGLAVKVLGGKKATDPWAVSIDAVGAGHPGDPDNEESVSKAVRRLETILVELHGKGGRSRLNAQGNFGLESFFDDASSGLNLPRATELLGRVLSRVHLEMDGIRSELKGTCVGRYFQLMGGGSAATALPLGDDSPFDLISIVESVRTEGLPRFAAGQLSADHVRRDLDAAGLTPAVIASIATFAKQPRGTRWGPATLPPALPSALASSALAVDARGRPGSPAPPPATSPLPSRSGSPAPLLIDTDVKLVTELELVTVAGVCPWWSLFGKCVKSATDECARCPTKLLATQAQVDEVTKRAAGFQQKRVIGVPTDAKGIPKPNPAPGTGKSASAQPSPAKKPKIDTG